MYTYNLFCFGINPVNLNNKDFDINKFYEQTDYVFKSTLKGWAVETHYHGSADNIPITIGNIISDDDNNTDYIDIVRGSREEDYMKEFNQFKNELTHDLDDFILENKSDQEMHDLISNFKEAILKATPCFYSVQVSS